MGNKEDEEDESRIKAKYTRLSELNFIPAPKDPEFSRAKWLEPLDIEKALERFQKREIDFEKYINVATNEEESISEIEESVEEEKSSEKES